MRKLTARRRGNTVVEFVLSFFLIFTAFTGTFQFGYSFYTYNVLVNAVHSGARFASLQPYDSATATPTASYRTAVQNVVVYGVPDPPTGAIPMVNGLTREHVILAITPGLSGTITVPAQVTVSISGFTINAVFQQFLLTSRPAATFVYAGLLTPPLT